MGTNAKTIAASAWQPIETAPKSGALFLAIDTRNNNGYALVHWNSFEQRWFTLNARSATATHWQPLPEPPTEEKEAP